MDQRMTDLEREIMSYSEFSVDDIQDEEIPPPFNVQEYYKTINKNQNSSIFDRIDNYNNDESQDDENHNYSNSKPTSQKFDLVEELARQEGHHVRYSVRGRGRGRGSTPYSAPPGPNLQNSNLPNTEEMQRKLRQHRIGLSDEEIVAYIKAKQHEKREEIKRSNPQTPREQSSYPGYKTPTDSPNINYCHDLSKIKESVTQHKLNPENIPAEVSSDSDSFYTIHDTSDDLTNDGKSQGYSVNDSSFEDESFKIVKHKDEEPKKPLPLSQILKIGRAERKLKKSELNPIAPKFKPNSSSSPLADISEGFDTKELYNVPDAYTKKIFKDVFGQSSKNTDETCEKIDPKSSNTDNKIMNEEEFSDEKSEDITETWENFYSDEEDKTLCVTESEEEELSQKYIQQLLQQDKADIQKKQQLLKERQKAKYEKSKKRTMQQHSNWLTKSLGSDQVSSTSSSSSSDETLPWRRRGGSPPRHNWSSKFILKPAGVNIQSVKDFPSLK